MSLIVVSPRASILVELITLAASRSLKKLKFLNTTYVVIRVARHNVDRVERANFVDKFRQGGRRARCHGAG